MTGAASRTRLPPVAFTDEDAREYRGIADESFRETRALYEAFLYERMQTLDVRRWKHIRTKGAMKVYHQRSGSGDTSFNSSISTSSTSVTAVSSVSSPDPLEVDDALLIGPASSLSVATKIPVVVCTGTVQGTLDDIMYGIFVHDTTSLRRRSIYDKDGMNDLVMLGTLESPTEQNPFDFLGVAWILYSATGLGAIVEQRDYVVLMSTGFATTSRGERIGYSIAQSISLPNLPELNHLGIVRASMSFCVIFRQQSDQIVESFAHAVIDPGGTVFSFFVLQEIANSILGMGAPMACAQGKKLRWYLHGGREATSRGRFRDVQVLVLVVNFHDTDNVQCTTCHQCVCKNCSVSKNLVVRSSHTKSGMTAHAYPFCLGCFLASRQLSTEDIQREEAVFKRLVR
ncbi:hypothetical protein PI124_g17697 [Phytophthora idaei]|nr:hypothetical protein PI125_g11650 [Phytophthora idaei]KAG3237313.1 hypothetical protein PI124_g17697 [Phytophthora idaei]